MSQKKQPTIKDIARETDLSITTVSLILNKKADHIPEETQKRVLKAVKDLGYRPNQNAVAMKTNKTGSIGLIIPDFANDFFARMAKEINQFALEKSYRLLITESQNNRNLIETVVDPLLNQQVDGVLFSKSMNLDANVERQLIELFDNHGIPLVLIDSKKSQDVPAVLVDHEQGGYLATRYLLEQGHRKIACYTGPQNNLTSQERIRGYQRALNDYEIEFDERLLYEGDYSIKEDNALDYFLQQDVSAVFCLNDMMAFGIYRQAYDRNISIPEDISVIGFDDISVSNIVNPTLTTVRQPIKNIAENAVEMLDQLNREENVKTKQIVLETELIVRDSVRKTGEGHESN